MDRDDQLEVYNDESAEGAPIVEDSPPRRRRRLAIIAAGPPPRSRASLPGV
jgi:hypothetical protein